MGDRVSISFRQGKEESPVLFSHWGGMAFVREAKQYLKALLERSKTKGCGTYPLDRREPGTVMVDFIRHVVDGERVESNYYLGRTEDDGDSSDNGHWSLDVDTGEANGL